MEQNNNLNITENFEAKPEKENIFKKAKRVYKEYTDKEKHPKAAKAIKIGEEVAGFIGGALLGGWIVNKTVKGVPTDVVYNGRLDELEEGDSYEDDTEETEEEDVEETVEETNNEENDG